MSRPTGAPRSLYDRPKFKRDGNYALQPGCVADKSNLLDVQRVRKETHDLLIEQLGDRRLGGVQWMEFDSEHGRRVLGELDDGRRTWKEMNGFLASNPHGLLILAVAEGAPE